MGHTTTDLATGSEIILTLADRSVLDDNDGEADNGMFYRTLTS